MLTKPHIVIIMSSNRSTWVNGNVVCRSLNFLILAINSSTRIRTLESCLDISTSLPESCFFPFVKLGMLSIAPRALNSSFVLKSQSTSIEWPMETLLKKPDSLVIYLSDTRPPHPKDKKIVAPAGVIFQLNTLKYYHAYNFTMSVLLL